MSLAFIVLFFGCKDEDPCLTRIENETKFLSDSIQSLISDYANFERFIFENDSGEEVRFVLTAIEETFNSFLFSDVCSQDTTMAQVISGVSQLLQFSLFNQQEMECISPLNNHT